MTASCARHRLYLAAVADGEGDAVPAAALEHIEACPSCAGEVELHARLGEALRVALAAPAPHGASTRSAGRVTRVGAAVSVVVTAGAAAAVLVAGHRQQTPAPTSTDGQIQLAASVSRDEPAIRTRDPASIATWCATHTGRAAPPVSVVNATPVGARTDTGSGAVVVTIYYSLPTGRASISWIDAHPASISPLGITERGVAGGVVLVVNAPDGLAVVGGDAATADLWSVARALELDRHVGAGSPDADPSVGGTT